MVDVTGTSDLGNGRNGIDIRKGCDGISIGGESGGNFIGSNGGDGVYVLASGNTSLMGNFIGIGTDGSDLSNAGNGVTLQQADNGALLFNLVVYNAVEGVSLQESSGWVINFNGIGDSSEHGISFTASAGNLVFRNNIMDNRGIGVVVWDQDSLRDIISQNAISGNGGLAIDLLGDGVTPNDGNNNPFKPNRGYNYPLFDQAEFPLQGGAVQVSGNAPPNAFVELYRVGSDPDPSGHGQAMDYLTMVSAGADGAFTASLEGVGIGDFISAIAISPEGDPSGDGNTSEFSANALVVEGEKSLGDTRWYVAEGSTGGGFDTWLLVQNPNEAADRVGLDFVNQDGPAGHLDLDMLPNSPATVRLSDHVPDDFCVSTLVRSDLPVVVERSMYWDRRQASQPWEMQEGHANAGSTRAGNTWMVPEGSTGGGFDTYVLVANTEATAAEVLLTLMTEGGPVGPFAFNLPASSRLTLRLGDLLPDTMGISTLVQSDAWLAVERSMYWDRRSGGQASEMIAGHCSSGLDP